MKGPTFIALHELFDKINAAVAEYVDNLAERVVQLGGTAHGTGRQVATRSGLPEYPAVTAGQDHAEAIGATLAAFGKLARAGIDEADALGDKDGADVFTEISRGVEPRLASR